MTNLKFEIINILKHDLEIEANSKKTIYKNPNIRIEQCIIHDK